MKLNLVTEDVFDLNWHAKWLSYYSTLLLMVKTLQKKEKAITQ